MSLNAATTARMGEVFAPSWSLSSAVSVTIHFVAMATGPDPSLLLARAVGAAARAAAMGQVATAPEMRAHIGLVELACRDVRAWLQPPPTEAAELLQVDAAIGAHIKRLDDLEERLRANAGAKP